MKIAAVDINRAFAHTRKMLEEQADIIGDAPFSYPYEAVGAITEKYHDFIHAIRENDLPDIHEKATTLAAASVWVIASLLGHWEQKSKQ